MMSGLKRAEGTKTTRITTISGIGELTVVNGEFHVLSNMERMNILITVRYAGEYPKVRVQYPDCEGSEKLDD